MKTPKIQNLVPFRFSETIKEQTERNFVGWGLPHHHHANNICVMPNYIRAKFEGGYYFFLSGQRRQVTSSRARKGEVCIWQRRFWEHQIRDTNDLQRHLNYIHYNPVKHGLVQRSEDWPWSTYDKYAKEGFYGRASDFEQIAKISAEGFGEYKTVEQAPPYMA